MPPKSDDESVKVGDNFVASFDVEILKAEESADGKKGHVVALVSVYNLDYTMGWRAKHRVLDGAFSASIASQPAVPIFWQHNWSWSEQPPIGTGIASEQGRGLQVAADFFLDTEAGRSVFNAIAAGALKQWSIGYRVMKYSVEETDDGFDIIHIQEAELLEASSVLRGANPETDTLLVAGEQIPKALQEALDAIGDFMQAQKGANDALAARLDVIEEAHEMLVDTFVDDGASEAARAKLGLTSTEDEAESKSGEAVEPAERGGGEDS